MGEGPQIPCFASSVGTPRSPDAEQRVGVALSGFGRTKLS